MSSNGGNPQVYEAGDQRTKSDKEIEEEKKDARFHEGKDNAHKQGDRKDERTHANTAAKEAKEHDQDEDTPEVAALKKDPTAPAKMHGNEPSKGAKIDAQIQAEEEEELRRKGKA